MESLESRMLLSASVATLGADLKQLQADAKSPPVHAEPATVPAADAEDARLDGPRRVAGLGRHTAAPGRVHLAVERRAVRWIVRPGDSTAWRGRRPASGAGWRAGRRLCLLDGRS